MALLSAALAGFGLSFGLIVAIGPQNVFVLRQGLQRAHVFAVCLTCAVLDVLLILAGVFGVGAALENVQWLEKPLTLGAAAFIGEYGLLRFRSALNPQSLEIGESTLQPLGPTLLTTLGFTLLNPHVYLDTLLLIGTTSTRFAGDALWAFTLGASLASILFFFALGYGAARMSTWLSSARAWQRIDIVIGLTMLTIATVVAQPYL